MINNVVLVGRLTKDAELRYTPSNVVVATFTLAVNRNRKNENGEREADFINCVIWRQAAENLANWAKKGSLIGIATGIILGKLLAEEIYFVNVSTWRKYWKFSYKDRSKKSMKQQAINAVATEFDKQVKDDEADAILIGSYFVNFGKEYGDLESHKGS
ncbi:TPA: single-stranded DNA-binding protein [Streptococcus agalactiae]